MSAGTAGFWEGVRAGRLMLPRCETCDRFWHPRADRCRDCHGPVEYMEVAGSGTVYTFTVVHRPFIGEFAGAEPYVVADVSVAGADGVRLLGQVVDADPDGVGIGARVRTDVAEVADFGPVPVWRIA